MEKELMEFISKNNLDLFGDSEKDLKSNVGIFKTRDALSVYNKVITRLSEGFVFSNTKKLWKAFSFIQDFSEINKRQEFFHGLNKELSNDFLKEIKKPKKWWKPRYDVLVVTEDEDTFRELKERGCPVSFIVSDQDIRDLESYDIVQVINCENYSIALERLNNTVFLDSIEQAYLERYLEELSAWKEVIEIVSRNNVDSELKEVSDELMKLLYLIGDNDSKVISREEVEEVLERINENISQKVKEMTLSGDSLLSVLRGNSFPPELKEVIDKEIESSGMDFQIFNVGIPVSIDEVELGKLIKRQSDDKYTNTAEIIKRKSESLRKIPGMLEEFSARLLLFDFTSGLSGYLRENNIFPREDKEIHFYDSTNLLIDNPQGISFFLDSDTRCSILTGANSGGKTTLLEHTIQLVTLFYLGLPSNGKTSMPLFSEVYYFAKNKGSSNKGAFETLLDQMSKINTGNKTLILADEIESVTEPGVAGMIVSATVEYFLQRGCFLVIATHLGREIISRLPKGARVDGIEAKGLDEDFNLIIDHNPVIGRLANSTPELIVEKLANSKKTDYFSYLNEYLKKVSV